MPNTRNTVASFVDADVPGVESVAP
jgi:hypothetical protein